MLSFKEKRAIQKEIKAKYAELEAKDGFKAKREIQKAIRGLYVKLGSSKSKENDYISPLNQELESSLKEIKDVITSDDATIEDWESIEPQIDLIEANEDKLENSELFKEVIRILSEMVDDAQKDSITGSLFDESSVVLDSVESGTYISREVVNAKQLKEWVKAQGLTPVEKPHVTIVYSKNSVDLEPKDDEIIIDKIIGSGILGKENVLVLYIESKQLNARHNRAKRLGATWDYDSYKPHITISLDNKELKELPDFEIRLGKEIIKPIDGDFSYRRGEK